GRADRRPRDQVEQPEFFVAISGRVPRRRVSQPLDELPRRPGHAAHLSTSRPAAATAAAETRPRVSYQARGGGRVRPPAPPAQFGFLGEASEGPSRPPPTISTRPA